MPAHLRSTALTAAACSAGVRVYTKTKDGDVREGCNDTTEVQLAQARQAEKRSRVMRDMTGMPSWPIGFPDTTALDTIDHGDGWYPGELRFRCSPDSTLCSIAWAEWNQSVFYQTDDGSIRERRHINDWEETDFVQPGCLPGTNIAAVYSSGARDIFLFFQDREGYLCYCSAKSFNWSPAVRLCKAIKGTGIGATAWDDCSSIRVYFQDEDNVVREYVGVRDNSNWGLGDFIHPCNIPIGDIRAVNWHGASGIEIRVYFQEENFDIVEWCYSSEWTQGEFRYAALPHSDIVTYMRYPDHQFQVAVMWAGQDQVLWQRVLSEGLGWLKETPIAFLQSTGRFFGSWTGTSFTDNSTHADRKVVRQVQIRSGWYIDGLALDFTDGTSTDWHGGQGGNYSTFALEIGEDITSIRVTATDKVITGLQFITSKGRESSWYGRRDGTSSSWELDGRALGGFIGSTTEYVNGLMPFWSERYSPATLENLESCVKEGEHIHEEIKMAAIRCAQLRHETEQLQQDIELGLRTPADHAIQGVTVLSASIEDLYHETQKVVVAQNEEVQRLVKLCKGQAQVVAKRFKGLYDESTKMMVRGGELTVELTAKLGESEGRTKRLENLQSVSDGLRKGAEVRAETMKDKKETAQKSAERARETQREAERKRDSAKTARTIRDIFTLGLGRLGDWFNLDEAVRYADQLVESCQRNLEQAKADMQAAETALSNIRAEVDRFYQLHSSVDSYKGELQGVKRQAIALRNKNMELQNTSLDLSLFLGGLVARTETIETKYNAAQFAKAVIAVEQLLVTPTKMKGLIRDDAQQLDSTLEMIARSDAIADALDDIL